MEKENFFDFEEGRMRFRDVKQISKAHRFNISRQGGNVRVRLYQDMNGEPVDEFLADNYLKAKAQWPVFVESDLMNWKTLSVSRQHQMYDELYRVIPMRLSAERQNWLRRYPKPTESKPAKETAPKKRGRKTSADAALVVARNVIVQTLVATIEDERLDVPVREDSEEMAYRRDVLGDIVPALRY